MTDEDITWDAIKRGDACPTGGTAVIVGVPERISVDDLATLRDWLRGCEADAVPDASPALVSVWNALADDCGWPMRRFASPVRSDEGALVHELGAAFTMAILADNSLRLHLADHSEFAFGSYDDAAAIDWVDHLSVGRCLLDCSAIDRVNSVFIGWLMRVHKDLQAEQIVLEHVGQRVRSLLKQMRLDSILSYCS